jgi:hypothetical protein
MKAYSTSVALIAVSLLSPDVEARKRLVSKSGQVIKQHHPNVRECAEKCLFKNDDNSWCLETGTPYFTIGWQYTQDFTETDSETPLKYF